MARSFYNSKLIQWILQRIGVLETYQGSVPPAEDYNTVADIRAETTYADSDRIFCLENQIIYTFDDASTATDDGVLVLKPNDIDPGDPGRWLFEQQLALKDHTHDDKADKIVGPLQSRFLLSDSGGNPTESTYHAGSFALASHTHEGYATAEDLEALETDVEANTTALDGKMDKYGVTAPDIGKPAVFDATGNVIPGSWQGTLTYHQFNTGALEQGITKTVIHGQNLSSGYILNARLADDSNNAMVQVLMPNAVDPANSIDIKSTIDVADPGLIIQIIGL